MTDRIGRLRRPRTTVRIPTFGGAELDAWFYEPAGPGPTRRSSWDTEWVQ